MSIPMNGFVAPGYEGVRDQLLANFDTHEEQGAQFCLMRHGDVLVDLWAGWADRKKSREVAPDTLFSVFSSGKAMAALVIAWLAEQDRLGYNQLVCTLWPEFTADGRDQLSVAQVMSHQSGLSGITDPDWAPIDWYEWDKVIQQLETQTPLFEPGSTSGYAPVTYGFLAGEIARRADADMRTLGRILREELSQTFDADVWIGLPEREHARCAEMLKPRRPADMGEITAATRAAFLSPGASPGGAGAKVWREAELAGSNCHATARGLAMLMQIGVDGFVRETPVISEDMQVEFRKSRISGPDEVLPFTLDLAAGVMRNTPNHFYGPGDQTIGHSGWGGSCVFADPETGLHGAYAMNRQHGVLIGDPRAVGLITASYEGFHNG